MMLDELRNLFFRALKCDDDITAIVLINEWNEAVKQVQDVFNNMTSKVSRPIKTNADEIRQMSDEELAKIIVRARYFDKFCEMVLTGINPGFCDDDCNKCALDWLKRKAKSND